MKVLLTGATGFVGGAILNALLADGHEVVAAARHAASRPAREGVSYREFDFMHPPEPAGVVQLVSDVDALVNAVGIIRERCGVTFSRIHAESPVALFAAAQTVSTKRIVQISAAGTTDESPFEYFRSKARADDYLLTKCQVPSMILRPSLVYGQTGEATQLFEQLASLPVVPLPAGGNFSFRPIVVDDLAQLVAECLRKTPMPTGVVEVGGSDELSLRQILLAIRKSKGKSVEDAPTLSIPKVLMKPAGWFGDYTGAGPMTSEMLEMLVTSQAPDTRKMREIFDYRPRGLLDHLGVRN